MTNLSIFCDAIEVNLKTGPDMCDITAELRRLIGKSEITDGHLSKPWWVRPAR